MARPPVSIVMPCRNAAETISDAILSIRNQTLTDWELLVCDDGSRDATLRVAEMHAAADGRIRVLPGPQLGIVAALQRGCAAAQAGYLARMDADDSSHARRLARQLALLEAAPDIALCGCRVRMVGHKVGLGRRRYEAWLNRLTTHDEIVRELFVECPIAHPAFFVRRSAFDAVGGYAEGPWAEDYDLVMRLYLAGARFANCAEVLLDWHERPGRLSMTDARYAPMQFRACKRHYLMRSHLADGRRFHQWGAGEVGNRWLREWTDARPEAVVDINPRKIGRSIHNVPVIAPEALPPPGDSFVVVAVGAPGARDEIRAWLAPRGYVEMRDFVFVA